MTDSESVKADKELSEPFAVIYDLAVMDLSDPLLRLVIALRSFPSSQRNELYAGWKELGRRSRLTSPSGNVRHVREYADQLRDLGLLRWEVERARRTSSHCSEY